MLRHSSLRATSSSSAFTASDPPRPRRFRGAGSFDDRGAQADLIERIQLPVGSDERAQEGAERDVGRRQIVERADAHRQHALRGAHALPREPRHEVGMERALRADAVPPVAMPNQVGGAPLDRCEEAVEHRGDEHGAERRAPRRTSWISSCCRERVRRALPLPALAELRGDVRRAGECSRGCRRALLESPLHESRKREVLEDGDDVREAFVEGEDVRVRRALK